NFFAMVERPLAANCVLLDGSSVVALNRFASISRSTVAREALAGLLLEIRWNRSIDISDKLRAFDAGGPYPLVRFRFGASATLLQRPVIADADFLEHLQNYWHLARSINQIVDSLDLAISVEGRQAARIAAALACIDDLERLSMPIEARTAAVLAQLATNAI